MLKMIAGAQVYDPTILSQGYEIYEKLITANVDCDNIRALIEGFIEMNKDVPLFLFVEVPAHIDDETISETFSDGSVAIENQHKDIYYLDGISAEATIALLDQFEEILINDGLSAFGVGTPMGEEIGKYRYNIVKVYGYEEAVHYIPLFEKVGIPRVDELVTAWDTISQDTPGTSVCYYDSNGRSVYDIVDTLKEVGMYKAEQREE